TVHLVEVPDVLRYGYLARVVVQLLAYELVAEHGPELLELHDLARRGVAQRRGLDLHVGADVVPRPGQLLFAQVNFVRDFVLGHDYILLFRIKKSQMTKRSFGTDKHICGATQIAETMLRRLCPRHHAAAL